MANPPPDGPARPLSDEARAASLRAVWEARPQTLAVFAYGSLMWEPCFAYADRGPAMLPGYQRAFAIWSVLARGTPDVPGLGLGLLPAPGAQCHGILYALPGSTASDDLAPLWEREMWTDTYRPTWVEIFADGNRVPALTFVVDEAHRQFAGRLPPAEAARHIAAAEGKFGTCRDYLADTVRALQGHGLADPDLEDLLRLVDVSPR